MNYIDKLRENALFESFQHEKSEYIFIQRLKKQVKSFNFFGVASEVRNFPKKMVPF